MCLLSVTGQHSYYRLDNSSTMDGVLGRCSSTVAVSMAQDATARMANGESGFGATLQEGFSVNWLLGTGWYSNCVNSGGWCGFNSSAPADHTCYCSDGTFIDSYYPAIRSGFSTDGPYPGKWVPLLNYRLCSNYGCRACDTLMEIWIFPLWGVINAGYRISGSHVNPLDLKSDAPMDVIWDIMRCWVKNHPVKAQPTDHKLSGLGLSGTLGYNMNIMTSLVELMPQRGCNWKEARTQHNTKTNFLKLNLVPNEAVFKINIAGALMARSSLKIMEPHLMMLFKVWSMYLSHYLQLNFQLHHVLNTRRVLRSRTSSYR